jgi:phosphorylcholine metabolism protein LicD
MFQRLGQYLHRLTSVYLTSLPGGYTDKKVAVLKEFYQLTNDYMKAQGVEYWIAYGTLLGQHRINGILPHDIDIDYGAPGEAFDAIWNNREKLPKGLKLYNTSKNHRGPKLFFSYKGYDGDFYFYEKVDQTLVPYLISSIPSDMQVLPLEMIYPLKKVSFLDKETYISNKTKDYLELCYGYIGAGAAFDKKTGYWYKK